MKKSKRSVSKSFKKAIVKGAKAQKLKRLKEKAGENLDEPIVDKFIDEDTPIVVDDAFVAHPSEYDVKDVLRDLDGFRDWQQESRGNSLSYGDY